MKTMKTLLVASAILLASGYTYVTAGPNDDVKKSVREKIETTIQSSEIEGQGEVTLKFGVTENNKLLILKIESTDKELSQNVKEALYGTTFPKGTEGVYQIKLLVNEVKEDIQQGVIRDQIYSAVENIEAAVGANVKLKVRVVNPSTVQVLKAESANQKLAQQVKKDIESGKFQIPQKLNGEYAFMISFK